jgi:ABC-type multidrug transport system fused ATPase/permease subunit
MSGRRRRSPSSAKTARAKTTLIHLLLGLYRPQRGTIRFDGVPIEQIAESDLRRHCSAIFQDFARFQLTLRESIGVGNVTRIDDAEAVRRAAGRAGADALAAVLPDGYETVLDPAFGGVDISGGQWQKVALARSLMREADVLVLDEPTASLDPRAEMAVFEAFAALARGRTTFLISHRIGTARLADRILVLSGGRLVEAGRHDDLVAAGGAYAELFAAQRQWYAPAGEGVGGHA